MPYGGMGLGVGLLRSYFRDRADTLGDLLLAAKRESAMGSRDDANSKAIDSLALMLNPASSDLNAERLEHLELFNLIGDPLLKLQHADLVQFKAPATAAPGAEIEIAGTSAIDGSADVELVVRRDRLTFKAPSRARYETTPVAASEFQKTYERANDSRLVSTKATVKDGAFRARLTVPADASGPCHVRVIVKGNQNVAVGSSDIEIGGMAARPNATGAGK
jgi:predicted secreted protein